MNLCTPKTTKKLSLSIRNTKALVLAINNIHSDWMNDQDRSEWDGFYHRRIQKYRMIKEKLQVLSGDQSDALKFSCQEDPLSLSDSQFDLLTEEERCLYMQSTTVLGIGNFKGKSLCFTGQEVSEIHQRFNQLHKNKTIRDHEVKLAK